MNRRLRRLASFVTSIVLLAGLTVGAHVASAAGATYYVSPTGSDAADGTSLVTPFQTISKCAAVATAGDTCVIRGGTYRETVKPANSGTAGAPITFTAYPGEDVTVSGRDVISGAWTPATLADLPAQQRGAGGFEAGLASGAIWKKTMVNPVGLQANQVFVNGAMATEARWPNSGPNPLTPTWSVAQKNTVQTLIFDSQLTQPVGFWTNGFANILAGPAWQAYTATIVGNNPGSVAIAGGPGGNNAAKPNNRYFLSGVIGALDSPNEWFVAGTNLYLWTPDGQSPEGRHEVERKMRMWAFDLAGRSHINVTGLAITGASVLNDDASSSNVLDGIDATYISHFVRTPRHVNSPVPDNATGGIILRGNDHVVRNSTITFSAGNGVLVLGKRNRVENNLISEVNYVAHLTAGVLLLVDPDVSDGTEALVTRNTIYNAGRGGIVITLASATGGANNRVKQQGNEISYNRVFNTMVHQADFGSIEAYSYLDMHGTSVHHNWTHDGLAKTDRYRINSYMGVGIYFDLGSGHASVHHNVSWDNGGDALRFNGDAAANGKSPGNLVDNNTAGGGHHWALGIYIAPSQVGSKFRNNIFRGEAQFAPDAEQVTNLSPPTDPLFVDEPGGDFHLGSGSPAIDAGTVIPGVTDGYSGAAPDQGAYESGGPDWTAGCTLPACSAIDLVDDAATSTAASFAYGGTGWSACTTGCDPGDDTIYNGVHGTVFAKPYKGTFTSSATAGDTVTTTFTGTGAALHLQTSADSGIAAVSVDGGPETLVDAFTPATAGDQLVYAARRLAPGTHTLQVRVTGSKHPLSTGARVTLDRVDVIGRPVVDPDTTTTTTTLAKKVKKPKPTTTTSTSTSTTSTTVAPPPSVALWTDLASDVDGPHLAYFDLANGEASCLPDEKLALRLSLAGLDQSAANHDLSYSVYRTRWEHNGTPYFVDAVFAWVDGRLHNPSFAFGTYSPDGTPVLQKKADLASRFVTGDGGFAEVVIPVDFFTPDPAALLENVSGSTLHYDFYAFYSGVPTPNPGGTTIDTGGPAADLRFDSGTCTAV